MPSDAKSLPHTTAYDVVVFAASAGGQTAVLTLLRQLLTFDVPIVVMHHLPPSSNAVDIYAGRVPFAVKWADAESVLG
jgi:chemotaxis response regulator CheB